jgi:hypothetical protein
VTLAQAAWHSLFSSVRTEVASGAIYQLPEVKSNRLDRRIPSGGCWSGERSRSLVRIGRTSVASRRWAVTICRCGRSCAGSFVGDRRGTAALINCCSMRAKGQPQADPWAPGARKSSACPGSVVGANGSATRPSQPDRRRDHGRYVRSVCRPAPDRTDVHLLRQRAGDDRQRA